MNSFDDFLSVFGTGLLIGAVCAAAIILHFGG